MRITLEHKFFKIFLLSINGIFITTSVGIAIIVGLNYEFAIGLILMLSINIVMVNEYKKIRTLHYREGTLNSISYDKKEELIDLKSIKSVVLTGGKISSFYIYRIEYEDREKQIRTFLTAPLRSIGFNLLLNDIKLSNKEVKINRQFP
jgi:hypothetical protein